MTKDEQGGVQPPPVEMATITLAHEQALEALEALETKRQQIRDCTVGVANRYRPAQYISGPKGTSKEYTVKKTLQTLQIQFKITRVRMKYNELACLLQAHPDSIHVLKYMEDSLSQRKVVEILGSVSEQQSEPGQTERRVKWATGKKQLDFCFTGGIIIIAARPLKDLPELSILEPNLNPLHYNPTMEEIAALMWKVTENGYSCRAGTLTPPECGEVVQAVIDESNCLKCPLDMTLLFRTLPHRLQWKDRKSATDWRTLLVSKLKESMSRPPVGKNRKAEENREIEIVRVLDANQSLTRKQRLEEWTKQTNKSRSTYDRRLRTINAESSNQGESEN